MEKIRIKQFDISITGISDDDYMSLTDLAKIKNAEFPADVVKNWMRLRSTIEYLGLWESLNNQNFNMVEFDHLKNESGKNSFVLTPTKWAEATNAIGLKTKSGKYNGGTFAHRDISLEFASWISPEVKLYVIKEFQRLKAKESEELDWNGKRMLTKLNYLLHTDAIKANLIQVQLSSEQKGYVYASEADLLNVALFGVRAKEWRDSNPGKRGNIRYFRIDDRAGDPIEHRVQEQRAYRREAATGGEARYS